LLLQFDASPHEPSASGCQLAVAACDPTTPMENTAATASEIFFFP
jgi:hypothetical protein